MSYIKIESFKPGLDTRRSELTSLPGTLEVCENAHINPGGEIEKRKAFVSHPLAIFRRSIVGQIDYLPILINNVFYGYYAINLSNVTDAYSYFTGWEGRLFVDDLGNQGIIIDVASPTTATIFLISSTTPVTCYGARIYEATLGLQNTTNGLEVYGSASASYLTGLGGVSGATYVQLVCPISASYYLTKIVTSVNFGGKAWVVAQFANTGLKTDVFATRTFVFYDGVALGEWWNGYLIVTSGSPGFLSRMMAKINAITGFYATNLTLDGSGNEVSFLVTSDYGISFTAVAAIISGSSTLTAIQTGAALIPIPGYGAAASFRVTGGTTEAPFAVTAISPVGSTTTTLTITAVGAVYVTGDYITLSGFVQPVLNSTWAVTTGGSGSFVITVPSAIYTTDTGTVWRSAGISQLTVTLVGSVTPVPLLLTSTGTHPILMHQPSGDRTNDLLVFASDLAQAIVNGGSSFTAIANENLVSIYAPASQGATINAALLTLNGLRDFCTDGDSFCLALPTGFTNDSCSAVTMNGTNLLNGGTAVPYPTAITSALARNLDSQWMLNIVASIVAKAGSTYTAYYYEESFNTVPAQYQGNVIVSKINRLSNDSPDVLSVSCSNTGATNGSSLGHSVSSPVLHAVITDKANVSLTIPANNVPGGASTVYTSSGGTGALKVVGGADISGCSFYYINTSGNKIQIASSYINVTGGAANGVIGVSLQSTFSYIIGTGKSITPAIIVLGAIKLGLTITDSSTPPVSYITYGYITCI